MKKKLLSILMLAAIAKSGFAERVPLERAKSVAVSFLNNALQQNNVRRAINLELVDVAKDAQSREASPSFYIFNNAGGGFVIVAGDDAVEPIIGYSLENTVNDQRIPENFLVFMHSFQLEIEQARKSNARASVAVQEKWNAGTTAMAGTPIVGPLIKTTWGQNDPYNAKCPKSGDKRTLVGCVAAAMGQVMRYWNYPVRGTGKKGSVDFGNTTYFWGDMPTYLDALSSPTYVNAVSTLLYHAGVSVGMEYGVKGSSAPTSEAGSALQKYFGYSAGTQNVEKFNYTNEEWASLLKAQLDKNIPIIYRGKGEKNMILGWPVYKHGHAWICDGYDNQGMFSMNWGWYGGYNGFFRITDLEPNETEYQYKNMAVLNIVKPNRLALSAISPNLQSMCSPTAFMCSVTAPAAIISVSWTVPSGWKVNDILSTGLAIPIKGGLKVKITPAATFSGSTAVIKAYGATAYGENTAAVSVTIPTGKPTFTKNKVIYDIGSALHCFTPSKGATIQILDGTWKNISCLELFNGAKKTVSVRASNSCGYSGTQTFTLTSPKDLGKPLDLNEEMNAAEITIFPNPANSQFTIQTQEKIAKIDCFSLIGEKVNVELSGNTVVIEQLNKGMYFLYITNQNGKTSLQKFVKE